MNRAAAADPENVFAIDLPRNGLLYVIEDDITMFTNLHTLNVSENSLPFAKLGLLPSLKKLNFSYNNLSFLDLEVEGRFKVLEHLDLSYNKVDDSALIALATLPRLKYLDLTGNKLTYITPWIHDMKNWREHIIEIILPSQVAALSLNNEGTFDSREHKGFSSANDFSGSPGFPLLETLVLENNPIGKRMQTDFWSILGRISTLQTLNLNKTWLHSFTYLIPESFKDKTSVEVFGFNREDIVKFDGFHQLKLLYAKSNMISSLDDLVGILFLPSLKHVYLESNPLIKKAVNNKNSKRQTITKSDLTKEFTLDYVTYIKKTFGISIEDKILQDVVHLSTPLVTVNALIEYAADNKRQGPREFLHKRVKVSNENLSLVHKVKSVQLIKPELAKERAEKRHHDYSEKDFEFIVKTGEIPSIKTMAEYSKEQDKQYHYINDQKLKLDGEPSKLNDTDSIFKDNTFLTSVGIVQTRDNDALTEQDFPRWYQIENIKVDLGIPLPNNILGSVKALRIALKNPGSIWRTGNLNLKNELLNLKEKSKHEPRKPIIGSNPKIPIDELQEMQDIIKQIHVQMESLETNFGNPLLT